MMRAVLFGGTVPPLYAKTGEYLRTDPYAQRRLAQAEEVLGSPVLERFAETEHSYSPAARQAYLVTCAALADRLADEAGPEPLLCVGASYGHFPALHHVGALDFSDMLRLAEETAVHEDEWNRRDHGVVSHFFYRIDPVDLQEIQQAIAEEGGWSELVGEFSEQVHLLGVSAAHLPMLEHEVRRRGGVPILTIPRPEHCTRNSGLRRRLSALFGPQHFAEPRIPVVSSIDGELIRTGSGLRTLLLDDYVRPLRFPRVVSRLKELSVGEVVVVGPGSLFERLTHEHFALTVLSPETVRIASS